MLVISSFVSFCILITIHTAKVCTLVLFLAVHSLDSLDSACVILCHNGEAWATLSYSALDMQQNKVMRKSLRLESHLYILVATHIIAEAEIASRWSNILNDFSVATFDCEKLLSLVPREQEESLWESLPCTDPKRWKSSALRRGSAKAKQLRALWFKSQDHNANDVCMYSMYLNK